MPLSLCFVYKVHFWNLPAGVLRVSCSVLRVSCGCLAGVMRVSRIRVWVLGLRSLFCSKGYAACSQGVGVDSEGSRWVSAVTRDVNSSTLVRTNSWRRRSAKALGISCNSVRHLVRTCCVAKAFIHGDGAGDIQQCS